MRTSDQVERLYMTDAVFHGRVETLVNEFEREQGVRLDAKDRSLATLMVGFVLCRSGAEREAPE